MKKLILGIISVIVIAAVAYGTIRLLDMNSAKNPLKEAATNRSKSVEPTNTPTPKSTSTGSLTTDTTIKNDLSHINAQMEAYAADHLGKYPTTGSETLLFEKDYIADIINPVTKKPYSISEVASSGFTKIVYKTGYQCVDQTDMKISSSSRRYALQITLSSGKNYCVDNS